MVPRIGRRDLTWLGLICGAFILLTINVLFGTRGFDKPHPGLVWRVPEAPGIALGWGGVALLVVALAYALVSWVRGKSPGKVLAVLGTLVLAVGVSGVAAVLAANYARGGGQIGAWLGSLLVGTLGRPVAVAVLAAIAVPGILLSLAPLLLGTSHLLRVSSVPQARAWYPQPQQTTEGEEIPMQLAGTDVGPIRFHDPAAPLEEAPPPLEPVPARAPKHISGVRYADGGDADGTAIAEVAEPGELARRRAAEREQRDAALAPGVRYAEPPPDTSAVAEEVAPPPFAEPESAAAEPASDSAVEPAAAEVDAEPDAPPARALDEGADEPVAAPDPGARHLEKLSGTEIFQRGGRPDAPVATRSPKPAPPRPRGQSPKDIRAALNSLFTNLPMDELPPARLSAKDDEAAASEPGAAPAPDSPGQLRFFVPPGAKGKGAVPAEPPKRAPAQAPAQAPPKGAAGPAKAPPAPAKTPPPQAKSPAAHAKTPSTPEKAAPVKAAPLKDAPVKAAAALAKAASAHAKAEAAPTKANAGPAKAPAAPPKAPAGKPAASKSASAPSKPGSGAGRSSKPLPHPACADELYAKAVAAARERGSASLVHLKRALDIGYSRASSLIDAMVADGVLGEMTASGSRPTIS